jgi:hypothetical protein
VTLLSALSKAGKTTLLLHVVRALLTLLATLRIVWITEEPRSLWRARRQARAKSRVEVTEGFFFDDPRWKDRQAIELLQEYLDGLERIVAEADARFGARHRS